MKRGTRIAGLPVGKLAQQLPVGRRKSRTPDLSRITKNLPNGIPGGRTTGAVGGVLLGAGAAVAAGRAIGRRGDETGSDEESTDSGKKTAGKAGAAKQAASKTVSKTASKAASAAKGGDDESGEDDGGKGPLGRLAETAGGALKGGGKDGGEKVKVTNIVEHTDVGAPRRLVYDQWTRFQDYPSFMKKVVSVDQAEDGKLHWKAKIFWSNRTWESTIVEQVPDEHIVWRSKGPKGYVNGTVSFHELAPNLTRVLLVLEYHPQGLFERTGNLWRAQGRRARLELKHFGRYVMTHSLTRADEIEGWRGEIRDSEIVRTHEDAVAEEEGGQKDDDKPARRSGGSNGRRSTARKTEESGSGSGSGKTDSAKADEAEYEKAH